MELISYVRSAITNDEAIKEQIDKISTYATEQGHTIIDTFVDNGYSGIKLDRPGLQELIKRIQNDKVDRVIVYSLDRLSRSIVDTSNLIDVFHKNDTPIISIKDNFDSRNVCEELKNPVFLLKKA